MDVSPQDSELLDEMRERESRMKRAQVATDAVVYRERRFRMAILGAAGLVFAGIAALLIFAVFRSAFHHEASLLPGLIIVVLSLVVGFQLGGSFLRSGPGTRLLGERSRHLHSRYAEELSGARRWQSFYYKGEDISRYVPQILYFLESDKRFTSVDEALAFAKQNRGADAVTSGHALAEFTRIAESTNLAVVASVGATGRPSSRMMWFVTTDRPGVWLVATSPSTPKVPEFDAGNVAIVTLPAPGDGTISSNRVSIARADVGPDRLIELFETQIPGYFDGVTEYELQREVVYEVTLQSATVARADRHDEIVFDEPA